jgi:hypothetical protein
MFKKAAFVLTSTGLLAILVGLTLRMLCREADVSAGFVTLQVRPSLSLCNREEG